jgi:hypothetical protein
MPATDRRVCQSQEYLLCFNGGLEGEKIGKPFDFEEFSLFPRERQRTKKR